VAPGYRPGNALANALGFDFGIYRVQLADLDTVTAGAPEGYRDNSCRRPAHLTRGTTYTVRVTTGTQVAEQLLAWLDSNQNGTFETSEQILTSTGHVHTATFTVPATLPVGARLRLRLAADYLNSPVPGPCTTPQYSQSEDYQVQVTDTPSPAPQAAFTVADTISCTGVLAFQDASRNAPTSWRWRFGDGTGSSEATPTHAYGGPGAYQVSLRVCNARGCDSLTNRTITVRGDGPKPIACHPSTLAYCCEFGLARVQLADLDHRPGGGGAGCQLPPPRHATRRLARHPAPDHRQRGTRRTRVR